jgi:hypothetical protein
MEKSAKVMSLYISVTDDVRDEQNSEQSRKL